jgi:hypothetical protein
MSLYYRRLSICRALIAVIIFRSRDMLYSRVRKLVGRDRRRWQKKTEDFLYIGWRE